MEKKGITVLTADGRDMAHYGARVAHRYIATVLGLFIVAIAYLAVRQGKGRSTSVWVPLGILTVTIFLSLLGYYTPTRANPLITMGNLLGGMGLLGLLWWLMQRDAGEQAFTPQWSSFRPLAFVAFGLVSLQLVLGGWSSANYASASCPGLLECRGDFLGAAQAADVFNPGREIQLDAAGAVVQSDALGLLSMTHRVFAVLTAIYLAWLVRRVRSEEKLRSTALAMSAFSIGQIVIGVSMIWLSLPLFMLTMHNAFAAGLLLSSINLLHRLTPSSKPPSSG